MRQWRLIYDEPTRGPRNMAIDEAILLAVSAGEMPPTLRLYGWEPMCLSMGYGQRIREIDLDRIERAGWDLVRRPTGGRAILHGDELTYSVSLPIDHPLAEGTVVESYHRISTALMQGVDYIGVIARADPQTRKPENQGPVCFEVPSHYEVTANGHKLIGSAQVRRKEGILQHGSIPLYGDVGRICDALVYETEEEREIAKDKVRNRAITMERALGHQLNWQHAADAIVQGFAERFGIEFYEEPLSVAEWDMAQQLLHDVYTNNDWTFKR